MKTLITIAVAFTAFAFGSLACAAAPPNQSERSVPQSGAVALSSFHEIKAADTAFAFLALMNAPDVIAAKREISAIALALAACAYLPKKYRSWGAWFRYVLERTREAVNSRWRRWTWQIRVVCRQLTDQLSGRGMAINSLSVLEPPRHAMATNVMAAFGISPNESSPIEEYRGGFVPNRVLALNSRLLDEGIPITSMKSFGRAMAVNASQATVNSPSEFLSNYAVRYTDPNQDELRALREMIAPEVPSNNSAYVQYAVYDYASMFLAMDNPQDIRRGVGSDFPTLRNPTHNLVTQRLPEVGLAIEVDEEEELLDGDWQQRKVALLLGIIDRTELRQAITLFAAGATNVNKTWDTSAGKDPDMDVITEINAMLIKPNNIWYGPGSWTKRLLSLRAQNLAGQANSSTLSIEQVGNLMNATIKVPQPRFANTATTTTPIFGSVVMLWSASSGISRDDFSNLKTFIAPGRGYVPMPSEAAARTTQSARYRQVWVRQVGDRRWRIVVSTGKRLVALTSAIGLETITVS